MSFYSNKDLQIRFGLSEQTCYDLVSHRRIPFFPYARVKKKSGTYPFNIYTEKTIRQLLFLLYQQEGKDNDDRAHNLMSWATDNYTTIKQEDMDMFFKTDSDFSELSRKIDSILQALKIDNVQAAVKTALNIEHPNNQELKISDRSLETQINATVHASSPIKSLVHDALEIIIEGLPSIVCSPRGFKKSQVIDLVQKQRPVLSNRMRKHKDVVWEHTRKFMMENHYLAQGPSLDTLVLGSVYTGNYLETPTSCGEGATLNA